MVQKEGKESKRRVRGRRWEGESEGGRKKSKRIASHSPNALAQPFPLTGEAEWPGGKGAAFGGIRRESQQYDLAGRSQVTLPILSPSFLGQ